MASLDHSSSLENSAPEKSILKLQKCSEEFILTLMEGENDSLEVFLPGHALPRHSIQWKRYLEETKVGPKKAIQDFKEDGLNSPNGIQEMKLLCRLWMQLW